MAEMVMTSVRLEREMKERIKRLAAAQRRTAHWILREAVKQYVDREEKREGLRKEGMAAWTDFEEKGRQSTAEAMDAFLSRYEEGIAPLIP